MTQPKRGKRLLIYAPVPLHRGDAGLMIEAQAVHGLQRWADHFEHVSAMMPLSPAPVPVGWVPEQELGPAGDRIRLLPLPMSYRPDQFARHLPETARQIGAFIDQADYLCFAIGGLFGDWGAVAAFVAHRRQRPFAVWTDRVESEVTWRLRDQGTWRRRLMITLTYLPMKWLEKAVVRRAQLGLFHGKETYDAYARHCGGTSMIVHDIHIGQQDHIRPETLAGKMAEASSGPLRICYVGRLDAMKGALDWVEVLGRLFGSGVSFDATWLGEGSERPLVERRIGELGMGQVVHLPGFAADQARVLDTLRRAHILLFCHKTPESPRCLIEALVSGTPILGYDGAFARDLISGHGGGALVPRHDVAGLSSILAALDQDRGRLAQLMEAAARDGAPFNEEAVFHHRSALILRYL